jgi:hypothetical protein
MTCDTTVIHIKSVSKPSWTTPEMPVGIADSTPYSKKKSEEEGDSEHGDTVLAGRCESGIKVKTKCRDTQKNESILHYELEEMVLTKPTE